MLGSLLPRPLACVRACVRACWCVVWCASSKTLFSSINTTEWVPLEKHTISSGRDEIHANAGALLERENLIEKHNRRLSCPLLSFFFNRRIDLVSKFSLGNFRHGTNTNSKTRGCGTYQRKGLLSRCLYQRGKKHLDLKHGELCQVVTLGFVFLSFFDILLSVSISSQ